MKSLINLVEPKTRYKILTAATHERTSSNMDDINADFYLLRQPPHIKDWNNHYAKLPKNHYILPLEYLPDGINFDFILSQNRFAQFPLFQKIASQLQIPIILWEHTLPTSNLPKQAVQQMKQMRGNVNVYIGKNQARAWEEHNPVIIGHCVNTEIFYPYNNKRNNHIFTVANDFFNRGPILGGDIYLRVTKDLPIFALGDTPGFSKSAKNVKELSEAYRTSRIYINCTRESPIPTSLLEALASGCACVSTNNCDIPEYIQHGVSGLLANNEQEMRQYLEQCLQDEDLCKFLGENARNTILQKCSKERFTNDWNNLLNNIHNSQLRTKDKI